jgi:mono/diheme cytochrome c family protein
MIASTNNCQSWVILALAGCTVFLGTATTLGQDESNKTERTFNELKIDGAKRSAFLKPEKRRVVGEAPKPDLDTFQSSIKPILIRSCADCHGEFEQEGNVRIDTLDPDLLRGKDVAWWTEVLAVVSNGEMPPPDEVELPAADRSKVIDWLSNEILTASIVRRSEGGHSSFRRMTKYEYNYALQDILGLPFDFARDLPPEPSSENGFKNSSELLQISVAQLETYRRIARKALQRATGVGEQPQTRYWSVPMKMAAEKEWVQQDAKIKQAKKNLKDQPEKLKKRLEQLAAQSKKPIQGAHFEERSTGRVAAANWVYHNARYAFKPGDTLPEMPDSFDTVAILPRGRNQRLVVELGDQLPNEGLLRVKIRASKVSTDQVQTPSMRVDFGWRASNEGRAIVRVFEHDTPVTADSDNPEIYQFDIPMGEVYPRNSLRNVKKLGDLPSPSEFLQIVNSSVSQGPIKIDFVEVSGPVFDQWPPASHRQIFFDSPNQSDDAVYAREVLEPFMARAWRRQATQKEIDRKIKLFHAVRPNCDSMEEAMIEVLAAVLSSPNMIYLATANSNDQTGPSHSPAQSPATAGRPKISTSDLATRLSMFLWSSVPDAELLQLADSGQLAQPDVLKTQVERMLTDPRADRMSKHFVQQWLGMDLLEFLTVDKKKFPNFPAELKSAMQSEPIAFFRELLSSNQSVLNFIHADFTMVNERLAKHYGLADVKGNHFQRLELSAENRRGGLLTQAGLLAMNSDGTDSHPLKRGIWMLESLLNDPPPPPPPNVPEIDLADPEIAKMTLKERIEDHRNHAACMSCHSKIDPWGIAFENFDAVGRWRTAVDGKAVDASSLLFNQQKLDGMDGLKRFLLKNRQDQFVQALVHKMATYALGRPLTFADRSSINDITAHVRQNGDGLATMVHALIASELFLSD